MPYEQKQWFGEILDALDIPSRSRIQPDNHLVSLDVALISASCGMGNIVFPPDLMREIGMNLAAKFGEISPKESLHLYLTRKNNLNWSRMITNENEIIHDLGELGFLIIDPAS